MINRSVKIDIGGEERQLKFTLQALEELESLLPSGNVFVLATKEHWAVNEIVSACYCGLKVFDRKITRQKVEDWITKYALENENGMEFLRLRVLVAMGLSGIIGGDRSAFEDVLKALDGKEDVEAGK